MSHFVLTLTLLAAGDMSATASSDNSIVEALGAKPVAERDTWSGSTSRLFLSTTVDAGYLYARPRASFGYGQPHFKWFGVEANPIFSNNGVAGWVGVRGALPVLDVRAGGRTGYSFQRSYLDPIEHFARIDLERSNGNHAKYTTLEAEVTTSVSTRIGDFSALASVSYVTGVPDGSYVFEEQLRVIVDPPWVYRVRGQYGFHPIPGRRNVSVGGAVDVLVVPNRSEMLLRAGIVARVVLSRALEIRGSFVPSILSKDTIGLVQSDFTELGLRWRWATGD